jgi:TM2 domain-containing membrane protein YozV
MNHALKAAFLSGVVFPGLGQVTLKHYKRGIALILIVFVGLVVIVAQVMQQAFTIFEKMESEGGAMDTSTILNAVTQQSPSSSSLTFSIASVLITVCWIFGIIDAYRMGRKKDLEEQSPASRPQEEP